VLWIDPRKGSGELRHLFTSFSVPVIDDEYLDCGDFCFDGRGIDKNGNPDIVMVGVERKALADLIQCMDDARFVGFQLPKMLDTYHFPFLLIEGIWKPDSEGYVEQLVPSRDGKVYFRQRVYRGRKTVLYSALCNHINTMMMKTRLRVIQTADKEATVDAIANLYKWFNDKEWDQHRSHLRDYDPANVLGIKSSLVRRVAIQLPGVGTERSATVDKAFKSVQALANSNEENWSCLEGIGKATAQKIIRALRGLK
jgi:ERCC4-type nuclease